MTSKFRIPSYGVCLSGAAILVLLVAIVSHSWVTDDAFITFRTVKNFQAGMGMRYNLCERVQSFTHPLWFFLLSFGASLGIELFYWAMALGWIFSVGLLWLLWRECLVVKDSWFPALASALLLGASDAFLSFQTSGLENSASHLFLVLLLCSARRTRSALDMFLSILWAAFALLNRLDQVFLLAPVCLYCFINSDLPVWKKGAASLAAMVPLIAWESFSLLYFGFLFPNTKYVKLGGQTMAEAVHYGLQYVADYAQFEPAQLLFVVCGSVFLVAWRLRKRDLLFFVGLGVVADLLYTIMAGGDFMRGRFLVRSLIATVWAFLFLWQTPGMSCWLRGREKAMVLLALIVFGVYSRLVVEVKVPREDVTFHNERNYYGPHLWLGSDRAGRRSHPWARDAIELNQNSADKVAILGVNGQRSYYIGSRVDLIDPVGLTDAFIARTPILDNTRPGHFSRAIPEEYIRERLSGIKIEKWRDAKLQMLWRDIRLITQSSSLLGRERLSALWRVWSKHGI